MIFLFSPHNRYLPLLCATFKFPQSLGILGGRPGASTYIVGVQDEKAFYLDPHEVQQVNATFLVELSQCFLYGIVGLYFMIKNPIFYIFSIMLQGQDSITILIF